MNDQIKMILGQDEELSRLRKALLIIRDQISPTFGRGHTMSGFEASEIAKKALTEERNEVNP